MIHAHNVSVFAWVEGDTVYVESKFSGGRRPHEAPVEVFDARGRKLLDGKTDDQGRFSFAVPAATDLKIVVQGGMGHRAEWTVRKSEITGASDDTAAPSKTPVADVPAVENNAPAVLHQIPEGLSAAEVEAIVAKVVENKLAPIRKMLVDERRNGPTFKDIVGGIGYILGLIGLAAYIGYRKKNGSTSN